MLGTAKHAQAAADYDNLPRGRAFSYLGGGASRSAYLHKSSGIVYKVERSGDEDNRREWEASKALRQFVWEAVYIPRVHGWDTTRGLVLAMEFIDGTIGSDSPRKSAAKGRRELLDKGQFSDMHGYNFIVVNDVVVPVDMGAPRKGGSGWGQWDAIDTRLLDAGDGNCW